MISDYTELSKEISYALRHAPEEYGLALDEQGWVPVEALLGALKKRENYSALTAQDIADMIQNFEKKRYELAGGWIRALYGHSTEGKIKKAAVRPPDVLYHGTAHKFLQKILEQGLIPKGRQYVHLSQDQETAITVGKRRDSDPVILRVDAAAAWNDGVRFYHGNETIWLADSVPPKYIRVVQKLDCECAKRYEAKIDSWALFEEIKTYFEEQVSLGRYEDIPVKKPYYIWQSGKEKMEWNADKWYKCKICGCLWELVYPDFPADGEVRKFADGVYKEKGY